MLSVLGRGLRLGGESVLTSPLPVCLSDGGHARPCDPSDLIRCRKYVKSQKARGRTGTPVHTRHRHSVEYNEETKRREEKNQRREASGFLFSSLSFYWLIIISI